MSRPKVSLYLFTAMALLHSFSVALAEEKPAVYADDQGLTAHAAGGGKKATAELPNFHQVHPYLYRGGQPSATGLQKLQGMGIKTIVDLRAQTPASKAEKAQAEKLGLRYINMTMTDAAPTNKQVETFMAEVKAGRDQNKPVFVHCAHGSDRTGCLVGIWRVKEDGYSYDQAYKEMRRYYFGPQYTRLSAAVKERAAK